jgi:hypothetical protein
VLLEFLMDPLLPLPHWNKGREVVFKPYVWPIAKALPDCGAHLHHDLEINKWSSTPPTRTILVNKPFGLQGRVLLDHDLPLLVPLD